MTLQPNVKHKGTRRMRPLLKRDIERAYDNAPSSATAAIYLGVSKEIFKKYAVLYGLYQPNKSGKGIKKPRKRGLYGLLDILDGKYPKYDHSRLRDRMIRTGMITNSCELCGYDKILPDGRGPYALYCKDGDSHNLKRDNIELRCYNCFYLTTGAVFKTPMYTTPEDAEEFSKDLDISAIQAEAARELTEEAQKMGLYDSPPEATKEIIS